MSAEASLGEKIRYFRMQSGMTMKALAAAVGITSSMLSQIEHDKANPSLNTIRMIAKTLNVPMFRLFMTEEKKENPVVRKDARHIIAKNDVDYELLTPDMDGIIEFSVLRLGKEKVTVESPMSHPGEEVAVVIRGSLELRLDDEVYILNEGDSVRIRPHQIHNWKNNGDGEAVLVFAVSPPEF